MSVAAWSISVAKAKETKKEISQEVLAPYANPLRVSNNLRFPLQKPPGFSSIIWDRFLQILSALFFTIIPLFAVEATTRYVIYITNPTAIFIAIIALITFRSGFLGGFVSGLTTIVYAFYYFSSPNQLFQFGGEALQKLVLLIITVPFFVVIVGILRRRSELLIHEQQARAQAEATVEMVRQLQGIIDATLGQYSIEDLRKVLLRRIKKLLNVDTATLLIREDDTLVQKSTMGLEYTGKEGIHIPIGKGFTGKVALEKKPIIINDVDKADLFSSRILKKGVKSLLGVPLLIEENVIGVLHIGTFAKRSFTKEEVRLLELIADRAALAIDRAYQYQKAQDAVRARDEFLSIASHELKTPLTSMLLQLQGVLKSIRQQSLADFSVERMLRMLESAEQQSRRLAKLINDLLNVSLMTAGKIDLEREQFDITTLVKEVVGRFEEQARLAKSPINLHTSEPIVGYWDRLRLEQVLANLLSNAIKYGKNKPIDVIVGKQDSSVQIIVTDRGIGIPENKLQQIFKRFERAVSSKEYAGMGVGLYIAHQIIVSHGGDIFVKSTPTRGSTFTIQFPITSSGEKKVRLQKVSQ